MSKKDAIRVIVGDGSRVDRDLVRFMLERDGFRVISSVAASEDLNRAASVMQPDAVVLGEELLDLGGGQAARLARGACPDAKIVLFSALPAAAAVGPGEPDAVLERGIGLKDLTRSLNDLFQPVAAGTVATLPMVAAGARPSAAPTPASPLPPPLAVEPRRRPFLVLAAAAAAMILLVFVVARNFPADDASVRSSAVPSSAPTPQSTDTPTDAGIAGGSAPATSATGQQRLNEAMSFLDRLEEAVQEGRLAEVSALAHRLAQAQTLAAAEGADVSDLNLLIQSTLAGLTEDLNPLVGAALRGALGRLAPAPTTPGSGPSAPDPSNEQPRPDPTTSPPPADGTGETPTPPPTDSGGTDPSGNDDAAEDPDAGAEPPQEGAGDDDSNVGDGLAADRDPDSSNAEGAQDGSNAPAAESTPTGGGDQGGDDQGGEPGSDQPIASTEPSSSTGTGDRETTAGGDLPDDGDGDAAADGS